VQTIRCLPQIVIVAARDRFRERGALGHLSFGAPK